jgi:hypothetical protein
LEIEIGMEIPDVRVPIDQRFHLPCFHLLCVEQKRTKPL